MTTDKGRRAAGIYRELVRHAGRIHSLVDHDKIMPLSVNDARLIVEWYEEMRAKVTTTKQQLWKLNHKCRSSTQTSNSLKSSVQDT